MKMKFSNNASFYYFFYVLSLIFFGIFFLLLKHDVGNDSSVSDWFINYSGGFVRRGIIGEISTQISYLFSIDLRDTIFVFQSLVFTTYYILVFYFFRNIKNERLFILSIFSPLFILYPVAEMEVLGRKELFIFLTLILYFFTKIDNFFFQLIYKLIILPISILIWEPVIFFFTFLFISDLVTFNVSKINKKFFYTIFSYVPVILTTTYIYLNPISIENYQIMALTLKNDFNQICYMSCRYVGNQNENSFLELININLKNFKFTYIFRYFLIILLGFFPIFILLKNSKLAAKNKNIIFLSKFKNLLIPFLIILFPSLILYFIVYDWGRIVHISYTFTILTFFFLYKSGFINLNELNLPKNFIYKISKKKFIILFFIFCFSWNPKVVISDDIASKPIYTIPYKFYKYFLR